MTDINTLYGHATQARLNAYAPYSNFLVGAAIETSEGTIFSACNVENASYGLGICAEASAITKMIAAGERHIRQVLVVVEGPGVSACCGACRQRLYEFSNVDTRIHFADLHGNLKTMTINELLPFAFGPKDLGMNSES